MGSRRMSLEGEFQIGEWWVKPYTNTIVGPKGDVRVEPKAMQVLVLLASRQGEVVAKQDILTEVWEGTYVSDEVLPNAIWEVRKALGDDARNPRFIQTLPKKGYRLITPVESRTETGAEATADGDKNPTRKGRGVVALTAAAAATVIALAIVGVITRGGSGDGRNANDPFSVLVLDFENQTNASDLEWLASGAPTMLRTGLAEVPGLSVVSAQRLAGAADELGAEASSRAEIAKRCGAGTVVVGSVFQLGHEIRIDVQIEDVANAHIVAAHTARGEDVFQLMDELTQQVSASLRGDASSQPSVPPIREMTTSSLEAFRLYNEGVVARRHLRIADARAALTEAVRIDPDFALAYAELQMVAGIGRDEAAYEEFGKKVHALKDRLPPGKRLLLETYESGDQQPPREAEAALLELIARRPDEEEAYVKLSHLYNDERSLAILEQGAEALPYSGYMRLLYGYALLKEGRYTDAIRQFEAYARIEPEEANPMDSLGEAYLVAGNPERSLHYYARALTIDETFAASHVGRSWAFALTGRFDESLAELDAISGVLPPMFSRAELDFQRAYILSRAGRYREASALLAAVEKGASESESKYLASISRLFLSLFALERGDAALAMERAEQARALLPDKTGSRGVMRMARVSMLLEGVAASRAGNSALAAAHLEALEPSESNDPWARFWYHLLLGEIALGQRDPASAYQAFSEGIPERKMPFNVLRLFDDLTGSLSLRDGTARAKALEGDRSAAIEIYERLLRPDIGLMWTAMLEPRYHLALARLHRDNGDRAQASRHYQELLRLWSKADPELKELSEAEAYLASS